MKKLGITKTVEVEFGTTVEDIAAACVTIWWRLSLTN